LFGVLYVAAAVWHLNAALDIDDQHENSDEPDQYYLDEE